MKKLEKSKMMLKREPQSIKKQGKTGTEIRWKINGQHDGFRKWRTTFRAILFSYFTLWMFPTKNEKR